MRKATIFAAGVVAMAAWGSAVSPAHAFQETPVAPPVAAPGPSPATAPGLTFERDAAPSVLPETGADKTGRLGLNVLPKLNFGLELLYGPSTSDLANEPANAAEPAPAAEELTILGKIRRRF